MPDNTPSEKVLVPKPSVAQQTELSQSSRFGNIRIDSKSLFKEGNKTGRPESGLDQMKTAPETTTTQVCFRITYCAFVLFLCISSNKTAIFI